MYADQAPKGSMVKKSTRKTDVAYGPDAVSEADYIAVYTDTLTDQAFVAIDEYDGRPHIPIGSRDHPEELFLVLFLRGGFYPD